MSTILNSSQTPVFSRLFLPKVSKQQESAESKEPSSRTSTL